MSKNSVFVQHSEWFLPGHAQKENVKILYMIEYRDECIVVNDKQFGISEQYRYEDLKAEVKRLRKKADILESALQRHEKERDV